MHYVDLNGLRPGDMVRLRWTGSRHISNRLGGSWARVVTTPPDSRSRLVIVDPVDEPGARRGITVDHIDTVERDGREVMVRRPVGYLAEGVE